jgi:hypothetical protein
VQYTILPLGVGKGGFPMSLRSEEGMSSKELALLSRVYDNALMLNLLVTQVRLN